MYAHFLHKPNNMSRLIPQFVRFIVQSYDRETMSDIGLCVGGIAGISFGLYNACQYFYKTCPLYKYATTYRAKATMFINDFAERLCDMGFYTVFGSCVGTLIGVCPDILVELSVGRVLTNVISDMIYYDDDYFTGLQNYDNDSDSDSNGSDDGGIELNISSLPKLMHTLIACKCDTQFYTDFPLESDPGSDMCPNCKECYYEEKDWLHTCTQCSQRFYRETDRAQHCPKCV